MQRFVKRVIDFFWLPLTVYRFHAHTHDEMLLACPCWNGTLGEKDGVTALYTGEQMPVSVTVSASAMSGGAGKAPR